MRSLSRTRRGRDGNIAGRQNGAAGKGALRRLLAKAGLEEE